MTIRDQIMRYTPAALALSLALALTASVGRTAPPSPLDPRAAGLMTQGHVALQSGNVESAVDAFEAALTIQPGSLVILLDLAEATRRQGMQGKALHYYREALKRDPQNLQALAGEGAALVEKGAVEKAKRNLARLEVLCGKKCAQAQTLAAVIAKGPAPRMVSADVLKPEPVITAN